MKKLSLLLALAALAGAAHSQTTIYSNLTNFSGQGYANGGATATSAITTLVADDITVGTGAGVIADGFTFTVVNFDTTAFTARPRVRFYAADGTNGAPGTYITGYSFNPISFTAGTVGSYTATGVSIAIPTSGKFWAGMTFDNASGSTATVANLNNLGQGLFGPATVGSSADEIFQTTASGSFLVNNPAGTVYNSPFGGAPTGSFGWVFTTSQAVPEPAAFAPLALGLVAVLRRRKKA